MKKYITSLLFLFLLSSCSQKKMDTTSEKDRMNPGYAKISATVIEIDSTLDSGKNDKPCGSVPCYAQVKIDSVHGYGAAFGQPLIKGSTIRLKFMFTVEKTTEELFPTLDTHLPGVGVGSKFKGDIQPFNTTRSDTSTTDKKLYRIFSYQRIK